MIVFFDLFETLVHSRSMDFNRALYPLWEKHYRGQCAFEEMKRYGEELFDHLRVLHQDGIEFAFVRDELPLYAARYGGSPITMTASEEADFLMAANDMVPMDGIAEVLGAMKALGIHTVVLSNSGFTAAALTETLRRLGIGDCLDRVWSSADFGKIKPSKEFFDLAIDHALKEWPDEKREEILFVGDSYESDVVGALKAGIQPVWLHEREEKGEKEALIQRIDRIRDIPMLVRDLLHPCASLLETTLNTRDLGGYVTDRPGIATRWNRVYRSDRQGYPSERDIALLKERRITTIIDMRGIGDVKKGPSGFENLDGFNYLNYPIDEGSGVPESVEKVPGSYMDIARSKNIGRIFEAIANAPTGVMINCSAGKDRTGVVSALLLMICGVSREDIIFDYMITRTCSRERFKKIQDNFPGIDINIVIPRESYMGDFLDLFCQKYENLEVYFDAIGADPEMIGKIRKKMME